MMYDGRTEWNIIINMACEPNQIDLLFLFSFTRAHANDAIANSIRIKPSSNANGVQTSEGH